MKNNPHFMKKTLTPLILILAICFNAKATNYYIAASGNDANNGTSTSTPWKTLNKLNSFFSSLKPGDNVLLNRGDVFYGTIIVNKSGSSGYPITIGAYGSGADPMVTGFTTVSSWTNIGSNIWESTGAVTTLSTFNNVVVINGVITPMGRYPNTGYLAYQSHSGTSSITSSSLTGSPNWTGAEAVIRTIRWNLERDLITSQSGGTLSYSGSTSTPTDGYGFFIQNDPRTLDSQNEWYFNPSTKKLRIYSASMPTNVRVASIDRLAYTNGYNYITFDNIDFEGANTSDFENANGQNITVQNCSFLFSGRYGIYIGTQTSGTESMIIYNNVFNNNNDNAMSFMGYGCNIWIKNNIINNTGMIPGAAINGQNNYDAIDINGANSVIEYNTINNSGHMAIAMRTSDGMIARYNYISYFGMTKYDAGGIYSWNSNSTTVTRRTIDHNFIIYSKQTSDGIGTASLPSLFGIYLDGDSKNTLITNNTVAHCKNGDGIHILNSGFCTITNNVSYDNGNQLAFLHAFNGGMATTGLVVKNNIFFSKAYGQLTFYYRDDDNTHFNTFGTADSNYYARPIDDNLTTESVVVYTGSNKTLASWQTFTGQDAHSKKSPKSITDTSDLRFEYNPTSSNKTVSLPYNYIDVKGTAFNGSVTLAPYTSIVLIKNGTSTSSLLPAVNPANTVNGLDYKYYEGTYSNVPAFTNLTPTKTGTSSTFDITLANRADQFAFNFTGFINVPSDGQYTFYTNSDDGSNLYIDGVLVVNNDGIHAPLEKSGIIGLAAGKHAISVGFFENSGGQTLNVSYAGPGVSKQAIPASALFRIFTSTSSLLPAVNPTNTVNGINYSYYESSVGYSAVPVFSAFTPVKRGTSTTFNISLANRSTLFAFHFAGYINVPSDGQYTFYTTSDDGSNLYIDGVLVVNNDGLHGPQERFGTIGLKAGKHAISVGYFQQLVGSILTVSYSGPGISKQVIPASALFVVTGTIAVNNNNQTIISSNQVDIKAYPNPFADNIIINITGDAGNYSLMLVDVSGKILWTKSGIKSAGAFQQSVNTSTLQRGVYFVKVIQNNNSSVIKMVK